MSNHSLNDDFDEISARFGVDNSSLPNNYFDHLIMRIRKTVKSRYLRFKEPKVMDLSTYTRYLLRLGLIEDFSYKTMKTINSKNPPVGYKNRVKLYNLFPPPMTAEIRRLFYNEPLSGRRKVWSHYRLPVDKIAHMYKGMLRDLNTQARKDGFGSRIEFSKNYYKIPDRDYKYFATNYEEVIDYCNSNLSKFDNMPNSFYSRYNKPCYFCRLDDFTLRDLKQTRQLMEKRYPLLYRYKTKIKVSEKRNVLSKASYLSENDSILIVINKDQNIRHRCLNLIHELCHAVTMLEDFSKGILPSDNGAYLNEKRAIELEMVNLKSISDNLYLAYFSDFLLQFRQTLFEIEMFTSSVKNPGKLYAEVFNKCFKPAKQKFNPLYILEERSLHYPLSTLHYAVAEASIVHELIRERDFG